MTDWTLDAAARELIRDGMRKRLSEKPFRVLQALVEARGEVVTREHLQKLLWSEDTFVDFDNNLNSAVATLRQALGDSARAPRHIETIPKVGYRLKVAPTAATRPVAATPPWATRDRRVLAGVGALGVVMLTLALGVGSWSRAEGTPGLGATPSPQAQALFERGAFLRGQFRATHQSMEPLTSALDAFVEAGRLDPSFGSARAEAAETLVEMSFAGAVGFRDGLTRARQAATEALALLPDDGRAARVMGVASLFLDWDAAVSRTWLERARAAGDDAKTAMAMAMWSASAGEPDAAVEAAERAVALDPAAYYVRADLAMFYLVAGRNADAARASREVLAVAPDFAPARAYALLAHERLEQWADAAEQAVALMSSQGASAEELARVSEAHPKAAVAQWRRWDLARLEQQAEGRRTDFALELALRHAALGDVQAALGDLETALRGRNALLAFVRSYPELMVLQGDPAFEAIARTVTGRG